MNYYRHLNHRAELNLQIFLRIWMVRRRVILLTNLIHPMILMILTVKKK